MASDIFANVKRDTIWYVDLVGDGSIKSVNTEFQPASGYTRERFWSSQSKPWIRTLPYTDEQFSLSQKEFAVRGYGPDDHNFSHPVADFWGRGGIFYTVREYCRGLYGGLKWVCDAEAHSRMLQKAKTTQWDAAVDLAEGRETLSLARAFVEDITRIARAAKGKGLSEFARTPLKTIPSLKKLCSLNPEGVKHMSSQWLQYHFGIMPVINSIKDSVSWLNSDVSNLNVLERYRSSSSYAESYVDPQAYFNYGGWQGNGPLEVSVSITNRRFLACRRPSTSYSPSRELGFDSALRVGWELVPLSFVVDWVVDVGGFIENVNLASEMDVVNSGRSSECVILLKHSPSLNSGGSTIPVGTPGGFHSHFRRYERELAEVSPVFPTISNPFTGPSAAFRSLSALALTAQHSLK